MFGILTILSHAHRILTIQYNHRIFLWNYIWILVQQVMNYIDVVPDEVIWTVNWLNDRF